MADAILTRKGVNITKSFSDNEYELLADYTVSGSAMTSITFGTLLAPLRINADEEIVLVSDIVNTSASNQNFQLTFNGNNAPTNYYIQQLQANSTSVAGGRANTNFYIGASANQKGFAITNIKLTNNGYIVFQSNVNNTYGTSSIYIDELYVTSTFTTSQITSMSIIGGANIIGIGSRFQLYKVKGQVQQTWATT